MPGHPLWHPPANCYCLCRPSAIHGVFAYPVVVQEGRSAESICEEAARPEPR